LKTRGHSKLSVSAAFACAAIIAFAQTTPDVVRTVLQRHDTTAIGYEAILVQVDIPVGGREGRHTHPGLALVRIEQGTLTLDYEGKPAKEYKAGESFMIEAGKIHEGINNGNAPVRAIATFVIAKDAPVTTPVESPR
jgi:quercetin dioxygenase-like cupin family protein